MRVLVYGAGVIGCYLTHVLCEAGNAVSLLARGAWKENLEKNGLVIYHHLQKKTTIDHPKIVSAPDNKNGYDIVFAVMQYDQMMQILEPLSKINTKRLILVGNNMEAAAAENYLREHGTHHPKILFGFQTTAGRREAHRVVCERLGKSGMDIGRLREKPSEKEKNMLHQCFQGTGYSLNWQSNMESYLLCHAASILPLAYLTYICGGDLTASTRKQRQQAITASGEGFALMRSLGYPILPAGEDKYFTSGIRRAAMNGVYDIMSAWKEMGDLIACSHCRHAVSEIEEIDAAFEKLRSQKPEIAMPAWQQLREAMPSWDKLKTR